MICNRLELLPTVLELMPVEIQQVVDENCIATPSGQT